MAKRSQYDSIAIDEAGNALDLIEITVYQEDGTTEATIYDTKGGAGLKENPFETTVNGNVNFWAEPNAYKIKYHDTALTPRISDRTIEWSAVSGDVEGIDESQIPPIIQPGDTAGGDLAGTFPSPTIGASKVITSKILDGAITPLKLSDSSKQIFPQLSIASTKKINFGKTAVAMGGTSIGIVNGIAHGLGVLPQFVLVSCDKATGAGTPRCFAAYEITDATNFSISVRTHDGSSLSGNVTVSWIVIG